MPIQALSEIKIASNWNSNGSKDWSTVKIIVKNKVLAGFIEGVSHLHPGKLDFEDILVQSRIIG
ncbi:MAG: hypothetical protein BWX60_00407 [Candidatus Marinimicrobia bacterium ADurb.Bin030]|nr:MAG: hypothetical protein BWX60_00407 [Candidatus Marinimicrobia bacterium ADurb.Bin030]